MKVVVTSDIHGRIHALDEILKAHPDADMYIDCGDSELAPERIVPFVSVEGNNDRYFDFPDSRVLQIGNVKTLIIHSHQVSLFRRDAMLAKKARAVGAKIVLFGHHHVFYDKIVDGVRLISPGSVFYNRDHSKPSYALVRFNGTAIAVERHEVKRYPFKG